MTQAKSGGVADDHPVVRTAVKMLLARAGYHQVHEVSNGAEVMTMLLAHRPEVLVLDLNMPKVDGLGVLQRIQCSDIRCPVIVFTSLSRMFYQERCMRAGASAYVSKSNDLQHLEKALAAVKAGYTYFEQLPSSSVSMSLVQRSEKELIQKLSDREMTIFRYLASGVSNKEIAAIMNLSHKTVSTYKTRLTLKLNVVSAVHLRDLAQRHDLI